MNDRPSMWLRGLISVATAVAVNAVLFYAFDAMGIALRVPAQMGATEMTDMTLPPVLIFTAVPTSMAIVGALILNRSTPSARKIFSSVVVLVAFLSLLALLSLDSSTIDRVFQGVMHLMPASVLLALFSPTLRSE